MLVKSVNQLFSDFRLRLSMRLRKSFAGSHVFFHVFQVFITMMCRVLFQFLLLWSS